MTCICIIHNGERYHHPMCTSFHTVKAVGYTSSADGKQLMRGCWPGGIPVIRPENIPQNNFHVVMQTNGVIEDPTPVHDPINPRLRHWRRKRTEPSEDQCDNCGAPKKDSPDGTCIYCKKTLPKSAMDILVEAAKFL